jgi:hypothetical protein
VHVILSAAKDLLFVKAYFAPARKRLSAQPSIALRGHGRKRHGNVADKRATNQEDTDFTDLSDCTDLSLGRAVSAEDGS